MNRDRDSRVALVPTDPSSRDAVRAVYADLVPVTRQQDGCLSYDVYESSTVPGVIVVQGRWRSAEDVKAHSQSKHLADAIAALQDHLTGDIVVHALDPAFSE